MTMERSRSRGKTKTLQINFSRIYSSFLDYEFNIQLNPRRAESEQLKFQYKIIKYNIINVKFYVKSTLFQIRIYRLKISA